MKIRLTHAQTIEGRDYGAGQPLEIQDDLGAALVASGDADQLPEDALGCFVSHQQFDTP